MVAAVAMAGGCSAAADQTDGRVPIESAAESEPSTVDSSPASTGPPSIVTTSPSTIATETEPPITEAANASGSDPIAEAADEIRFVESVIGQPPSEDGWILPAGTWHISSFEPTLRIDTSRNLVLVEQSQEAIALALPGSVRSTELTLLVPAAVASDGNVRNAPGGIDFEKFLEASEWAEIGALDTVTSDSGDTLQYADIRITPPLSEVQLGPCRLGPACVWTMETAHGDRVQARPEAPIRLITLGDESPVRVVATAADDEEFGLLAAEALSVARSITAEPDIERPTETPTFLSMISTRLDHIPAGHHVMALGDVEVHIDLDEQLHGYAIDDVERDAFTIAAGDVSIGVVRPWGYADPDVPQVNAHPDSQQLLDQPLETVDEFEAWAARFDDIDTRQRRRSAG